MVKSSWRRSYALDYAPKNIAVTCLWSFGITDNTPVFDFAERLNEIKKGEVYSLTIDSTNDRIYLRTQNHIPIAIKFEIKQNE